MEYKLAKELKDAGFPLHYKTYITHSHKDVEQKDCERCYPITPTLSELIESCGEGFDNLERWGKEEWASYSPSELVDMGCGCCSENTQEQHKGKTPEEAVVKLWLALNKK